MFCLHVGAEFPKALGDTGKTFRIYDIFNSGNIKTHLLKVHVNIFCLTKFYFVWICFVFWSASPH